MSDKIYIIKFIRNYWCWYLCVINSWSVYTCSWIILFCIDEHAIDKEHI